MITTEARGPKPFSFPSQLWCRAGRSGSVRVLRESSQRVIVGLQIEFVLVGFNSVDE